MADNDRIGVAAGVFLGLGAGFASAVFGIGGGLLLVPALTVLFRFPVKRAVGASLVAIALIAAVGVAVERMHRPENLLWGPAMLLALGALAGSWAGSAALHRLPERVLRPIFALFLAAAAARMLGALPLSGPILGERPAPDHLVASLATLACGGLAGATSAFFGVGGGIVAVPFLHAGFSDVPFHVARATSLVMIVPTSLAGAWFHSRRGLLDLGTAARIAPAGFVGAALGVVVANRLEEPSLRTAFAGILLLAAWRLLAGRGRSAQSLDGKGV